MLQFFQKKLFRFQVLKTHDLRQVMHKNLPVYLRLNRYQFLEKWYNHISIFLFQTFLQLLIYYHIDNSYKNQIMFHKLHLFASKCFHVFLFLVHLHLLCFDISLGETLLHNYDKLFFLLLKKLF